MVSKATGTPAFAAPIPPAHSTFAPPSTYTLAFGSLVSLAHWLLVPLWPRAHLSFSPRSHHLTRLCPPYHPHTCFCPAIHQHNGMHIHPQSAACTLQWRHRATGHLNAATNSVARAALANCRQQFANAARARGTLFRRHPEPCSGDPVENGTRAPLAPSQRQLYLRRLAVGTLHLPQLHLRPSVPAAPCTCSNCTRGFLHLPRQLDQW